MSKFLTALALGISSSFAPALSQESEEFFNPLLLTQSAKTKPTLAQSNNSPIIDNPFNKSKAEKRSDGLYFPLAIGGQQLSGFDSDASLNGEEYEGSLNSVTGFSGETGIGYKFGDFRGEFLYGYNQMPGPDFSSLNGRPNVSEIKSSDTKMQTLTFSLLYDINTNSRWTPYIGGSIGVGFLTLGENSFKAGDIKYSTPEGTQSALTYGGKLGLTYQVSRKWDVFLEGAYLRSNDYNLELTTSGKAKTVIEKGEKYVVVNTDKVTVDEVVGEGELITFLPNASTGVPYGEGGTLPCSFFGPAIDAVVFPQCFLITEYKEIDEETWTITTTETKIAEEDITRFSNPIDSDLDIGPGNGWSVKVGFRWFFNQPDNKISARELDAEPTISPEPKQQAPVRGLW